MRKHDCRMLSAEICNQHAECQHKKCFIKAKKKKKIDSQARFFEKQIRDFFIFFFIRFFFFILFIYLFFYLFFFFS